MTFGIKAALALLGFTAVIGQIVLMRELIVVFNGNEISLGMMLATWLLWTAAGSSLGSRFVLGRINFRIAVAALECLLGVSLLPTVWAVRASKAFFQTVPGELVGPVPMLLTSLICLSVFCILSGYLFVVATRLYAQMSAQTSAQTYERERGVSLWVASSSAYLFEAAGSALGGILASVVLLRFLESFQIATIVALLNLCMAAILLFEADRKRVSAIALVGICLAIPLLVYVAPSLDRSSQARLWRGFHLLESRNSIYGNLAVIETGNIRSIYDNGVILANVPDEAAAEEAVHYALLEHPAPKKILLIGGGANGSVVQVLKHPTVERIDYVELDPTLIDTARQLFPAQSAPFISDPRVHIHYADGRLYLKTSRDQFDVIILDLPDPQTAQLNRFYTAEFFSSAGEHLMPGGLLALQLRASEDYISPERAEFLRCIQRTLGEVFPYVLAIPGESFHFFGALRPDLLNDNPLSRDPLTNDPQVLIARLKARNLQTLYVREYFIPFRMMPDRMAQVHELLQPLPTTPVNRDFEPIAYYFDIVLWSTQFKLGYSRWFQAATHIGFARIVAGALAILLGVAILLASVPRARRSRASAAYCMAATGFTLMALQIFLLLGFQSVYGYVYHQLAILIAMFMAGIALGSWLGIRRVRSSERSPSPSPSPFRVMAATQFLLAVSGPALILLIRLLSRISSGPATLVAAQFVFPALAVLGGMLGGYQFPIATEIYLGNGGRKASAGTGVGVLYAIDLFGGCVGALLLSTYLVPVFGFSKTAWLSAAVNLAPALLAALLAARVTLEARTSRA
jgi:spermidine synthase